MAGQPDDRWEVGEVRLFGLRPRSAAVAGIGAVLIVAIAIIVAVVLGQLLIAVIAAGVTAVVTGILLAAPYAPLPGWGMLTSGENVRRRERSGRK